CGVGPFRSPCPPSSRSGGFCHRVAGPFGQRLTLGSQRISDSEISDFDCEDGIGVVSDHRYNGRNLQSSTLSVPEQVMSSNHCSRSADLNRTRSRSPSVPPPQSRSLDHGNRVSPSQYHTASRMDRHRLSEDRYSPDSLYLTLPRSRHNKPADHHQRELRNCSILERPEYHRSRSADQRPALERPAPRSRSTERPDSSLMRSMPSLPSGRSAPPSPALTSREHPPRWGQPMSQASCHGPRAASSDEIMCHMAHPRSGSVQTSPSSTPVSSRRGRQLPQLPAKGTPDRKDSSRQHQVMQASDQRRLSRVSVYR
ncbi:hypothetical protein Z043_113637, partial [Scleropages formosus]